MRDKLTIGIPVYEEVRVETLMSLLHTIFGLANVFKIEVDVQTSAYLHENRNRICTKAIAEGSKWVLFIDADMLWGPHCVRTLIANDKDIIGVNYSTRRPPTVSTLKFMGDDGCLIQGQVDLKPEPMRCYACGAGFLLVKVDCLKQIKPPWFDFSRWSDGSVLGEDIYFCKKAAEHGFEVWFNPLLKVGHVGTQIY